MEKNTTDKNGMESNIIEQYRMVWKKNGMGYDGISIIME